MKSGAELAHEGFERLRVIAPGICSDHCHAYIAGIGAKLIDCQLEVSHRERALVGTVGIPKIQQHNLASQAA